MTITICVAIFLAISSEGAGDSWQTLSRWGVLPAPAIWDGAYWGLLPGVFVHLELWHVAFNMYWLWVLGSRLELVIGHVWFLVFYLTAGFVSSAIQLAMSDSTGIGASGVGYAIFGFMWATRDRYQSFLPVLDQRTVKLFMIWLVGCIIITFLGIREIGNAAHVSGMIFGLLVAGSFVLGHQRSLMFAALGALLFCSVAVLVRCPWSITWLSTQAYHAHADKHYSEALVLYSRVIEKNPHSAWAYFNRSRVYEALGDRTKASIDRKKAREIDPQFEKKN